jgi:hypothetical protein
LCLHFAGTPELPLWTLCFAWRAVFVSLVVVYDIGSPLEFNVALDIAFIRRLAATEEQSLLLQPHFFWLSADIYAGVLCA